MTSESITREQSQEWRRLSPFSIVFFTFRYLQQLLNLYPVILGGAITAVQFKQTFSEIALYLLALLGVLVLGATLHYLNFLYIQENDRFLIRSGVFAKNRLELPFARIQNITIKEPFYFRPFNLVNLNMDSAGSNQKEVSIAALSREHGEAIKATIRNFNARLHDEEEGLPSHEESADEPDAQSGVDAHGDTADEKLLITRSPMDIVLHGITHNRTWFLLVLLGPLFQHIETVVAHVVQWVGFDIEGWLNNQTTTVLTVTFIGIFLILLFLTSLISVIGSILSLFNFRLSFDGRSYVRRSGLLNKHEIQVKKSRVQTLRYHRNFLDLLCNRLVLMLEPFNAQAQQQVPGSMMQKIMVPSINDDEFDALASHIFPGLTIDRLGFEPISRFFVMRQIWFYVLPVSLLVMLGAVISGDLLVLLGLLIVPPWLGLIWLRWWRYGWVECGEYIVVRVGLIGYQYFCLPRYKVQQVRYCQSVFLKRRNLATVQFVLASRLVELPFIAESDAAYFADSTINNIELSQRSWM